MGVQNPWIHDLRRTLGSYMAITGASLPIIGKALNHKSQDSTEIYGRLANEPVFAALNTAVKAMVETGGQIALFKTNFPQLVQTAETNSKKFVYLFAA